VDAVPLDGEEDLFIRRQRGNVKGLRGDLQKKEKKDDREKSATSDGRYQNEIEESGGEVMEILGRALGEKVARGGGNQFQYSHFKHTMRHAAAVREGRF